MTEEPRILTATSPPDVLEGAPPPSLFQATLLRDQVTDHLRQEILAMRFSPGQRLVERELIELLGVSRVTVRESIRQLAAEGLVQLVPQKGAVVTRLSREEVEHIWEVRGALESLATRLFAERASDAQIAELRRCFDAFERLLIEGSGAWVVYQAKNAYYEALFAGTGNPVLGDMANGLLHRVVAARIGFAKHWPTSIADELRAIVEAIEAHDPEAAERAAFNHVEIHSQSSGETIDNWLKFMESHEDEGQIGSARQLGQ